MTDSYGRSKSGTRVIKRTNKYSYKRYNLLCAISYNKVISLATYNIVFIYITYRLIKNSTDAQLEDFVFGLFKDKVLLKLLVLILSLFIYFYF